MAGPVVLDQKAPRRWVLRAVSVVLAIAVAGVMAWQIAWNDRVRLADGRECPVVGRDANTVLVQVAPGELQAFDLDAVQLTPGLRTLVGEAKIGWMVLACVLQAAVHGLLIGRWKLLMAASGERVSLGTAGLWHCRGQALGALIFGPFGSDAIRIQQSVQAGHRLATSASVIVAERLVGVLVLLGLATCGVVGLQRPEDAVAGTLRTCIAVSLGLAALGGVRPLACVMIRPGTAGRPHAWLELARRSCPRGSPDRCR